MPAGFFRAREESPEIRRLHFDSKGRQDGAFGKSEMKSV
jgi:hypothetical protein